MSKNKRASVSVSDAPEAVDWILDDIHKITQDGSPNDTRDAALNVLEARRHQRENDIEAAMQNYKNAMLLWFHAEELQPGCWSRELLLTNREYAKMML